MRNSGLEQNAAKSCQNEFNKIIKLAKDSGIDKHQIILDPGLGFGDLSKNNYTLLPGGSPSANVEVLYSPEIYKSGFPVLIGASRKRFIGKLMNQADPKKRLVGSLALAVIAACSGADILRVHDIIETKQILNKLFD